MTSLLFGVSILNFRNFSADSRANVFAQEIKNWLTCNLMSLSLPTLKDPFHQTYTKQLRSIRSCIKRYSTIRRLGTTGNLRRRYENPESSVKRCLYKPISVCKGSPAIVLKFIRLRMENVLNVLPYFPNMKVIHLLRDPRGIFNSRSHLNWQKNVIKNNKSISQFCDMLHQDLSVSKLIQKVDPDRLKLLQYEDLADRPIETASDLFSFAGLRFTQTVASYLKRSTSSSRDSCTFCTQRKNSSQTASKWRNQLKFDDAKYIYDTCSESMSVLGYKSFTSVRSMTDKRMASRTTQNISKYLQNDNHF